MLFIAKDQEQVLIIKRAKKNIDKIIGFNLDEHWQLPQGGTDNEDLGKATAREAKEELNISSVEILGFSKDSRKYIMPLRGQVLYKKIGQEQRVAYLKFQGSNNEIKCDINECDDYQWVSTNDLLNKVHPLRKAAVSFALQQRSKMIAE